MSTFLKLLPLELSGIADNDITEPPYPLEENDRVVGDMSNAVKQLFTLGRALERDANQNTLDSKYCTDKAKKLELETKANELVTKSQAVKALMWISIRDELGLWMEGIGVRHGFKVVITKEEDNDDIPPFIKRLLGGQ